MYKIFSKKVTPTDKAPEPYKEDEPDQPAPPNNASPKHGSRLADYQRCPHGYYVRSNCKICSEVTDAEVVSPREEVVRERQQRQAARILQLPAPKDNPLTATGEHKLSEIAGGVRQMRENPDPVLYDDIYPWSPILVGCKIARRIKPDQVGTVTMINYYFSDSKNIRELWVEWEGRGNATPYQTDELLRLRVQ